MARFRKLLAGISAASMVGALALTIPAFAATTWSSLSDQEKQSSYGFFVWKSENQSLTQEQRDAAKHAANILADPKSSDTHIGATNDATSLANFEAALHESQAIDAFLMKQPNEPCRMDLPEGQGRVCNDPHLKLTPKVASDVALAVSQSNSNWSLAQYNQGKMAHAQNFPGFFEVLAFPLTWRYNGSWCPNSLGCTTWQKGDSVAAGSWYEEKVTYDKNGGKAGTGNTFRDAIGHYTNITDKDSRQSPATYLKLGITGTSIAGDVSQYPNGPHQGEVVVGQVQGYDELLKYFNLTAPTQSIDEYLNQLAEYKRVLFPECVSLDPVAEQTINAGEHPQFPDTVTAHYSDNSSKQIPVTWDKTEPEGFTSHKGGSYTFTGTTQEKNACANVQLKVTVKPATVSSVDTPADMTVKQGSQLQLPESLKVTWSNKEQSDEPVTWDTSAVKMDTPGTYTVTGTVAGTNVSLKVTVTEASITAVDNPQQMTVASGTTQLDLPKTVHATFDNGTSRDVAVTWADLSAEQKGILASRKGGVITLSGTVAGWDKPVTLTINVTPATVASVELSPADTNVTTPSGTAPALAKTGKVTWSNGDTTQEPVTWDAIDKSKYSPREGGEFDVNGTLAGKPVTAHVTVLPATVTSVKELSPVTTEAKQAPQLPKTAEVTWSNGDTTQEPITWNISESDYAKRGEKQINGTILTGTKNEQKVSVTLTVTAHIVKVVDPEPITVASGTNPNGQLPSEVKVVYSDDEEGTANVVWSTLSKEQYSAREGGTFTVTGSVEGTQLPATQTIKVTPATLDTVDVPADLTVVMDTQAKLPETITGHYSNGDESAVPVTWDSSTLDTHTVGDYTLSGTVDGYSKPVSLTVHVIAAKIISVEEPTPLTVPSGTKKGELTLPQTVVAHFDNGTSADVPVTWSELTDADLQTLASRQGGTITLRGSVAGKAPASLNNLFVMLAAVAPSDVTLTINVEPATVTSASVEPTTVATKAQTAPQLPENATVTWSNGDTTQEPITWDEVNPQDYQNPDGNSFQVSGTVAGQKVSVTVNVTPLEITSITLTKDTVEIEQGAGFEMPNAIVTYKNGSTTVLHPRWEDKSSSEIHNPGSYVYNGTVTVRGEEKPVSFTLVVKEKAKEEPGKDDNKPGEKDNEGGKKPSKPAEPSKPAKPQADGKKASSKPRALASTGANVSIILLVALTALTAGAALRMSTRKH